MVLFSIIILLSLYTVGFTSVILSTIERRYQFSSTSAGLIASTFDMAVLVSVVFFSYFGGKGHKPRLLGISLIVQGAGMYVLIVCANQTILKVFGFGKRNLALKIHTKGYL